MESFFPGLGFQLEDFNGTIESLLPFLTSIHGEIARKNETIRVSENRTQKLLEQASNGIALVNSEGIITYVTPAVLKTFGYMEKELVNNPDLELGHPEEKAMLSEFLADIMSKRGKKAEVTYRVKTKSGEWRWVRSHVTNLLHEKGINSLVFNYQDITENVFLNQQLMADKRNTEALINSTIDLMWSVDAEMRLITANRAFLDRIKQECGVDLKPGDSVLDLSWVTESRAEKWRERYRLTLNGSSFTVNDHIKVRELNRWEETSFYPIYENGTVKGVSCFLRDITEKQMAFETIRKNEAFLAAVEKVGSFGSWESLITEDGNIIDSLQWSEEMYRTFGLRPGEFKITLKKFYSLIHPEDLAIMQQFVRAAISRKSAYDAEYRIVKPNGSIAWIRSRGRIVFGERIALKIIGTAQDISQKKLQEQERAKLVEDLLQRNKDFEQFTYVVSHNLRAPVANIQGLAEVFKMHVKSGDVEYKCAEEIYRAALRLDEIIKDMHSILQLKKEFSEKKTAVDLVNLANEVQESIRAYMEKQEGSVIADFNETRQLFTLRGYMYSIFYNLIMNSLKYRQRWIAPVITISSHVENDRVILVFRDNGMGIDMNRFKDKLFTLYQRFHINIEGKGIGLYMVKAQVEALGGSVEISSEVDFGTEISITLPLES